MKKGCNSLTSDFITQYNNTNAVVKLSKIDLRNILGGLTEPGCPPFLK